MTGRRLAAGVAGAVMSRGVQGLFSLARRAGPDRSSDLGASILRTAGPLLKQHRIALANIRAAFPEKTTHECEAIARGAWANLGRTGAEYAHLGTLFDFDPDHPGPGRIEIEGVEQFAALRDDGRPGIVFSAHLGNWELAKIAARRFGLDATAVFRAPNDPTAARILHQVRSETHGSLTAGSGPGAAAAINRVLEAGGHLAQLIDQHFTRGVPVTFFGRPALANPLLAKLARRHECPVHGARVVRLPGHRFRVHLTPEIPMPRGLDGRIDVVGATQAMTSVIEGWIREFPEQWLWMHRRWRAPAAALP